MSGDLVYIRAYSSAAPSVRRLSDAAEKRIEEIKKQYPTPRSAVMAALYIAQEELGGMITQEGVEWVAAHVGIPPIQVWEVATFYTMYYKKPVGKYHIQVCRTLPCALRGARKVSDFLHKKLGLQPGEVSDDGLWSFEEVECLGSCGTAPMCQINAVFFEHLTDEKLETILGRIEREKPDLRFSTVNDALGDGLSDLPRSQVRKPASESAK
jgi:NADH-quinone oxidoreductase subunit E